LIALKKRIMNTKTIIISVLIVSLFLASCKKENPSNPESATESAKATPKIPAFATEPEQPKVTGGNPNTIMRSSPMNPAHGQAGHRCDIEVGAPLNAPAGQNTPQQGVPMQTNNAAAKNPSIKTTPSIPTAKGMNPPHGQTGHRCDIAAGAPLNSPVTKTTPPKTVTPTDNEEAKNTSVLMNPSYTPAPETAKPVITAPGMNPPHGQDGHRCEIAVGAPLPKS
jgi:hypothetical protein